MENEQNAGAPAPAEQSATAASQNAQPAPAAAPAQVQAETPAIQPQAVPAKKKPAKADSKYVVEAALFSAGKPISVKELQEATNLPKWDIIDALALIMDQYDKLEGALEITKAGDKYAMQVKAQYARSAAKLAPMEIAPKLLKTLALIAYHQPIKQSQLLRMIGPRVYDHVPELLEIGLITCKDEGQTKILSITSVFPEYFGIDATKPEEIKKFLAKKVGISVKEMEKLEKLTIEGAAQAAEGKPQEAKPAEQQQAQAPTPAQGAAPSQQPSEAKSEEQKQNAAQENVPAAEQKQETEAQPQNSAQN
jgi:segregation and condensation protein B